MIAKRCQKVSFSSFTSSPPLKLHPGEWRVLSAESRAFALKKSGAELLLAQFETGIFFPKNSNNSSPLRQCACAAAAAAFETAVFLFLIWPRNAREGGREDRVHRRWSSWRNLGNVSSAKADKALLVNVLPLHGSISRERRPISHPSLCGFC